MTIRVLPEQLVHQIAAGEVVERPASIVKELVENSLDAGARAIEIEIEEGGAGLCRVRDDGSGIPADELGLALARHATSKIGDIDDLEAVRTLGFRGEALPSIASVSRMRMISRPAAADMAQMVAAVDGEVTGPAPHPHPPGTTVEVRDLFFNVPARRKFLRSERTELTQIERLVERLALSRFDVGFRLQSARRTLADFPPARDERARDARVAAVLGEDFIRHALKLDHEGAGMRLTGWFCLPTYARSQPDQQHFFLNGRPLRDRLIGSAVRLAYRDVLFHGRHPAYVLYLEMDPRARRRERTSAEARGAIQGARPDPRFPVSNARARARRDPAGADRGSVDTRGALRGARRGFDHCAAHLGARFLPRARIGRAGRCDAA